ncbi:MAG: GNAT family N-acetyltransferase [Pseudomonadota bacterium]
MEREETCKEAVSIRPAVEADLDGLYRIAADMEMVNEPEYFEKCFAEQKAGKRIIFVAGSCGRLIGYVQLNWTPLYPTFKRLNIPEVQDLNVVPDARGQGIGGRLVDACEKIVRKAGKPEIGISVGLCQRYGAAQRLYVKKAYVPDGAGVCYDDVPLRAGELWSTLWRRPTGADNLLTLKLVKVL